jgi:hypothetical protein
MMLVGNSMEKKLLLPVFVELLLIAISLDGKSGLVRRRPKADGEA